MRIGKRGRGAQQSAACNAERCEREDMGGELGTTWDGKKQRSPAGHGGPPGSSRHTDGRQRRCADILVRYERRTRILRKEVIQPQVPLRLPCYDLVPITGFIFGACPLTVSTATSDAPRFRGLTGGVYKAQEHIHRSMADLRLLAIPASCGRVAARNLN